MADKPFHAAFYEAFEEEEKVLKKYLPRGKKYYFTWKTIQEDGRKNPPAKIISIRTQSVVPEKWLSKIDGLITRSTGYDHVSKLLKHPSAKFAASYLPDYAARAVAEHAMMLWASLLRKLPYQNQAFKTFHRDGLTGREMKGRRISVIGVGRIGSQIVDIACGLGMECRGVDLKERQELKKRYSLRYLPLKDAIRWGEIIVAALPLTELTLNILSYKTLSYASRSAIFVNVGRGEVSPLKDLLRLVKEGIFSGVGLDVYNCESDIAAILRDGKKIEDLPRNSQSEARALLELIDNPSFILTPHNAFNTVEAVERKSLHTAQNLAAFFKTGKFITPIP